MMRVKRLTKSVDEEHTIRCASGLGLVREEVWVDEHGIVRRYNLAFIHHALSAVDHGRVLGYDNQHGRHHRHWLGETQDVVFTEYPDTYNRFVAEVEKLRQRGTYENKSSDRKL